MTIKLIPGQEPEKSKKSERNADDEKPIIREYIKRNNCSDAETFIVEKVKLTMNGWLLVETTEWVGFINGKAAVALALINDIAPNLHNKQANALVALIAKKNKFGFVLATDDAQKLWYCWDAENFTLTASEEQDQSFLLPTGALTLADFLGTESESTKNAGHEPVSVSEAKKRSKS
jgi:hypothetical protein